MTADIRAFESSTSIVDTYDHLHGELGEAERRTISLHVLVTKIDRAQIPVKDVVGAVSRTLRLQDIGRCGFYLRADVWITTVSCLQKSSVKDFVFESKKHLVPGEEDYYYD